MIENVPFTTLPPVTVDASSWKVVKTGGVTFSEVTIRCPPPLTLMLTSVAPTTGTVVTGSIADVAPPGIIKVLGPPQNGEFAANSTLNPPTGAGAFSFTVPVDSDPP